MSALTMPREFERDCSRFLGLARLTQEGPGYFKTAHNISSRAWPMAATPADRYDVCGLPGGDVYPFAADGIGWLSASGRLYYSGEEVAGWDCADTSASRHSAVMIGTKAVFFPDKAWFDTATGDFGRLEFSRTSDDGTATATVCYIDGVYPGSMTYGLTEPTEPSSNALWLRKDMTDGSLVAYRWIEAVGEWERQDKLLYRVFFDYAGSDVTEGERLEITACRTEDTEIGELIGRHRVARVEHSAVYFEAEPDRKLLPRICRKPSHSVVLTLFTMERRIPDLTLVCSAGERIWGVDADGSTLRASAPGDPFSWYSFDGYGGDSYARVTAYPGSYIGVAAFGDMPIFFKNDRIVRILGSRPDNYAPVSVDAVGLDPDSPDSAVCCGGKLYYKGADGYLYRWDGASPERLSDFKLAGRVNAGRDLRFCVFANGERFTVYDTATGAFCTEDGRASRFFTYCGALWYVDPTEDGRLCRLGDGPDGGLGRGTPIACGDWELCSTDFVPGEDFGCSPRLLCLDIESDGRSTLCVDFAHDGRFEHLGGFCFDGRIRRELPIPARRASTCAYRIRGSGRFVLRELAVRTPR